MKFSYYKLYHYILHKIFRLKTELWYKLFLKQCGNGNVIMPTTYITPEYLVLQNRIYIGRNARIEGVYSYGENTYFPEIRIDDHVSIQQNLHLTCGELVEIKKNTAIAANVTITDIHHPYTDITVPIEKQDIIINPVYIGEECKIYNNVIILPGTKLGKHCTIGANSVVSGIFPDNCIIVGIPAKIIKRYSLEKQSWLKTDAEGNFIKL